MKSIADLQKIINQNKILFDQVEMPSSIFGYYEQDESSSYILISDDVRFQHNTPKVKCIIAEEIGHYFTCIGINEPLNDNTYNRNLMIEKQEMKAMKWATDYLIDTNLLICYLVDHTLAKIHDIAEHFQVTDDFVLKKLEFMKRKKEYWKLKDKIYLCLSSLPTIYIADIWDDKFVEFLESY